VSLGAGRKVTLRLPCTRRGQGPATTWRRRCLGSNGRARRWSGGLARGRAPPC